MRLTLHFDGSCWPNPGGLAKYGFTLSFPDGGKIWLNGLAGEGPLMSNNYAELFGMAKGLEYAYFHTHADDIIEVKGDSEVALYLMSGRYKYSKSKLYYPAFDRCKQVEQALHKHNVGVIYTWIPRELNQECDDLSKLDVIKPVPQDLLDEAEGLLL